VALLLLLLGGAFLHRLPEIHAELGWQWSLQQFWLHLSLSLLVLIVPALVTFLAYGSMWLYNRCACYFRQLTNQQNSSPPCKPRSFIKLAYGYLPLILGGNLAHYLRLFLLEAGRILPVTWATFGINSDSLPIWIAHPAVVSFLQGTTLIASVLLTWVLTQKISRQAFRLLIPQHLAALAIGVSLWAIILPG
jgi:hypothetical protein